MIQHLSDKNTDHSAMNLIPRSLSFFRARSTLTGITAMGPEVTPVDCNDSPEIDSKIFTQPGELPFPYSIQIAGSFSVAPDSLHGDNFQPRAVQIFFDYEVIAYTDGLHYIAKENRWYYVLNVGLLGCGNSFDFDVVLIWNAGEAKQSRTIGRMAGSRITSAATAKRRLKPLLMSGLGRSGTTLLMKMLLQHEQIIGLSKHPYENQPAQYWLHALRVLSSPGERNKETPIVGFQQNINRVSSNPFNNAMFLPEKIKESFVGRWFELRHIRDLMNFFTEQIQNYYEQLGKDVAKQKARYYVEKTQPNSHALIFHELYPEAKEIFIIRHPFDVLCSVRAFFSDNSFYNSETYITALRIGYDRMLNRIEMSGDKCFLVDYKQIIESPQIVMGGIASFLGISNFESRIFESLHDNRGHGTSTSSDKSIHRWKTDLSPRDLELANLEFHHVMQRIGKHLPDFDFGHLNNSFE